ncbi:MAG TPA: hypothetical protein VG322_02200 [Candidatus Acidoferrales bacterium]|jgi:hypothetical protein|nr:hypothetical protein [Candidatus Acidoferrales bacterium]
MSAERIRIECALQDDARLISAVPLIVVHAARLAGIGEKTCEAFAKEAAEACRKALACVEKSEDNPAIQMVVDQFQDRIEITFEYSGHRISLADCRADKGSVADSVQQESSEGKSRLKFTKFCGALDPKPSK